MILTVTLTLTLTLTLTEVETVEAPDVARHATTVLYDEHGARGGARGRVLTGATPPTHDRYNERGDELEVRRVIHWGHATAWIFILCYGEPRNGTFSPEHLFGVGDTVHVRLPTRPSPASVLRYSSVPCSVSLLEPPASPPASPPPNVTLPSDEAA